CSRPSPSWSPPTARMPPPNLPRACPAAFAMASSRSICGANRRPPGCSIAAGLQGGSSAVMNLLAMVMLIPRSGLRLRALAVSLLALLPVADAIAREDGRERPLIAREDGRERPLVAQATQPAAAASRPAPSAARPPGPGATEAPPEIISDPTQLPAPVARMRARMLEAARSGDLDKLVTVMQSNETMPVFSF